MNSDGNPGTRDAEMRVRPRRTIHRARETPAAPVISIGNMKSLVLEALSP